MMADNRTGLSAADIAKNFRDRCGDGSLEWTYTPMQTWVLLDAADMLDENDRLRNEFRKMDEWHSKELLAAVDNNAKLRELVRDMEAAFIHGPCYRWCEFKEPCNGDRCQYRDRMRELGVDA